MTSPGSLVIFTKEFYGSYSLNEYVGHMEQLAKIHHLIESDGLERGNRIYMVSTGGGLDFTVNAERSFDISDFSFRGVPLRWRSPNGDVNPKYHGEDPTSWGRSFPGGLFVTCGLTQFGAPNRDGDENLPQHGHVSNLPAWNVHSQAVWQHSRYIMKLSAEIRQSHLFGERLVLYRTYSTELGSTMVNIDDVVRNESNHSCPHMILYHFNLGFPLISLDTELQFPVRRSEPQDTEAEKWMSGFREFGPPREQFQEQVFLHEIEPDLSGIASIHILNHRLKVDFCLEYPHEVLPYLYQWKMFEKGTYVLGIEPANCRGIHGRVKARENGTLRFLEPGQEVHYWLRVGIRNLEE